MSSNEAPALSVQPCTGQACSACSSLQWPHEPGQLSLFSVIQKSFAWLCHIYLPFIVARLNVQRENCNPEFLVRPIFFLRVRFEIEQLSCTLLFSRPALALGFSVFPLISKSPTHRKTLLHLGDIRHFGNQNCVTAHGTSFVYVYFLKVKITSTTSALAPKEFPFSSLSLVSSL